MGQRSSKRGAAVPLRVRILHTASGRGLVIDAELLQAALQRQGCAVEVATTPAWSEQRTLLSHRVAAVKRRLPAALVALLDRATVRWQARGKAVADLQIHLESPCVDYLGAARSNWLIPNQEWLRPQHLGFFPLIDQMLVKTDEAARQLAPHHQRVHFLGFSNPIAESMPLPNQDLARFRRFLHVAGRNRKKGTAAIVECWRRHPEWPRLELVVDDLSAFQPLPANVRHWNHPDRDTLQQLHRDCGILLAPSEVEGFGHILVEAMAHQNIVLTTDAAPMNELVTAERGSLVKWERQLEWHFGTRYFVGADAIEAEVATLLATPEPVLYAKACVARRWVASNDAAFLQRLNDEVERLRSAAGPSKADPVPSIQSGWTEEAHHG